MIRYEGDTNPNVYYEYKCPACDGRILSHTRADRLLYRCEHACKVMVEHRRVFGIATERPMEEHWNATLDMPISSNKQFDRELKRQSQVASEYAGIEQRYERVDMDDRASLGVTDEGLDATNRVRVNSGLPAIKID